MTYSPRSAPPPAAEWRARFQRTLRVLEQELKRGCRDDLVLGGLARLGAALRDDALDLPTPLQSVPTRVADLLRGYRDLPEAERRRRAQTAAEMLRAALAGRARPGTAPVNGGPIPTSTARPNALAAAPHPPQPATRGEADRPAAPTRAPRPNRAAPLPPPDAPISDIKRIGPTRARDYARLGIHTVGDLLRHYPSRHLDFPPPQRAVDFFFSQPTASFVGRLADVQVSRNPRGLSKITARLEDETGAVQAVWFRAGYGAINARPGDLLAISGQVEQFGGQVVFENPEWEPAEQPPTHTRRLVPVYPLTSGIALRTLRDQIRRAVDQYAADLADPLPDALLDAERLPSLPVAVRQMHFPDDQASREAARRRLAFDELLLLQLMMQQRRSDWRQTSGPAFAIPDAALDALLAPQPFRFTGAQRRVTEEVRADLARPVPMARLLQGEVGSGKTAVAAAALFVAVAAGMQGVLMAPTEILAEQHARSLTAFYERAADALAAQGLRAPRVGLLVGSLARKQKQAVYDRAAAGELDVLVGTHALIQDGMLPRSLGLVIVDEQHRFGVRQRLALADKGRSPHLLVMTATPIPRTLALSLYGDLDLSLLDELPPGRSPIVTRLIGPTQRRMAYELIRHQVSEGRQAFIICPLVEDSPHLEAKAATEEYERLRTEDLNGLRLALLHGRMRAADKEATMRAFRDGEQDVLVSTAVVEVGVDVPNATIMLIEGAERFGLAQLHQFRGRVGRGAHPGACILVADGAGAETRERLQALTQTASGLELAEIDLRLRGPGDYFGERQSGLPDLRVASLADVDLIERARAAALRLLADDPLLEAAEHAALRARVDAFVARATAPS